MIPRLTRFRGLSVTKIPSTRGTHTNFNAWDNLCYHDSHRHKFFVTHLIRENWRGGVYGSFKCIIWKLSETVEGIWRARAVGVRNDPVVVDLALYEWANRERWTRFHECTTEKSVRLSAIPWLDYKSDGELVVRWIVCNGQHRARPMGP